MYIKKRIHTKKYPQKAFLVSAPLFANSILSLGAIILIGYLGSPDQKCLSQGTIVVHFTISSLLLLHLKLTDFISSRKKFNNEELLHLVCYLSFPIAVYLSVILFCVFNYLE